MATVTLQDVKDMMASLGFSLPDVVVQALLDDASTALECFEANGYPETRQTILIIYAVARLAALTGGAKITSQHAPSGASRSFTYDSAGTDGLYDWIRANDPNDCLGFLPLSGNDVGFFAVVGGC